MMRQVVVEVEVRGIVVCISSYLFPIFIACVAVFTEISFLL
jgi:delta 1-pyrroline-5-carboxylate dehydrogenase